MNKLIKY